MTDLCGVGTLAEVDGCLRAIASRSDIASRLNAVREEIHPALDQALFPLRARHGEDARLGQLH
jgi:hypothetical protein